MLIDANALSLSQTANPNGRLTILQLGTVSCSHCIVTMAVSCIVSEIKRDVGRTPQCYTPLHSTPSLEVTIPFVVISSSPSTACPYWSVAVLTNVLQSDQFCVQCVDQCWQVVSHLAQSGCICCGQLANPVRYPQPTIFTTDIQEAAVAGFATS